jgi:hypothetical protein
MRIELTDRAQWLQRVRDAISNIHRQRAKEDAGYEASWARVYDRRNRWLRLLIGPHSRTPPHGDTGFMRPFYPSCHAWGRLHTLNQIEKALLSTGTGAVFVTGDEMGAIR